jgi:hypothetical protein
VTTVPKIGTRAPKLSWTGSQSSEIRNLSPKALNAGHPPIARARMIAPRTARTKMPDARARAAKILSPRLDVGRVLAVESARVALLT